MTLGVTLFELRFSPSERGSPHPNRLPLRFGDAHHPVVLPEKMTSVKPFFTVQAVRELEPITTYSSYNEFFVPLCVWLQEFKRNVNFLILLLKQFAIYTGLGGEGKESYFIHLKLKVFLFSLFFLISQKCDLFYYISPCQKETLIIPNTKNGF